jgi:ankyrin repeat protein
MRNKPPRARYLLFLLILALVPVRAHAGAVLDAVASGDDAALASVLSGGANVNERDSDGETALHAAVRRDRADMIKILLDRRAEVDALNYWRETPLSVAILNYRKVIDTDIVKLLLDHGADPGLLEWSEKATFFGGESEMELMRLLVGAGFTPSDGFIIQMAEHGSLEAARYVFSRPYDITLKGKAYEALRSPGVGERKEVADAITMGLKGRGRVALDRARWANDLAQFTDLLEHGADPNGVGSGGSAPILLSEAGKGRKEYVLALLDHGAKIDATDYPGHTALWEAVKKNDCGMIRLLIEHGADPEHRDKGGRTPMNLAAYEGREKARLCLEELTGKKPTKPGPPEAPVPSVPVRKQAEPTPKAGKTAPPSGQEEKPAFIFLGRDGKPEVIVNQFKKPDMPQKPELRAIAERADDEVTTMILTNIEQSDNGNIKNSFGQNIIIRLISLKAPDPEDSFRTLAAMGADLNIVDNAKLTPLLYAIGSGDFEATKALLKLGAKTEIPGISPNALHFALSHKRFEEARLLLDNGVNVNVLGPNRDTPLHQACLYAPRELIAHMIELGAMVNAREKTGLTPLHAAAFRGDPDIVRLLLDAGANPTIKDANGHVPKDWAQWEHHDEAAKLL